VTSPPNEHGIVINAWKQETKRKRIITFKTQASRKTVRRLLIASNPPGKKFSLGEKKKREACTGAGERRTRHLVAIH